jgi:micrococcal nuclease
VKLNFAEWDGARVNNVIKFSKKRKRANASQSPEGRKRPPIWAMAATGLVVVAAIFYRPLVDEHAAIEHDTTASAITGSTDMQHAERQSAQFTTCFTGGGTNCVVDGDTFWFGGEKIRISDIDAPETHPPRCQSEAELGQRATVRLQELLNAGPFELEADNRDQDRYGWKLRDVMRDGKSIGLQLVSEGLARPWDGGRKPWC